MDLTMHVPIINVIVVQCRGNFLAPRVSIEAISIYHDVEMGKAAHFSERLRTAQLTKVNRLSSRTHLFNRGR
ncbi:hypothetical protein MRX96_015703 [Rhipicephalus microplus]